MASIYNYTGWHTAETIGRELSRPGESRDKEDCSKHAIAFNALLIAGYIPGLGLVAGGMHIGFAVTDKNLNMGTRVITVIRGVCEILGLGLLFLIPDLIVSMVRHISSSASNATPVIKT